MRLTLKERVDHYNEVFAKWPASTLTYWREIGVPEEDIQAMVDLEPLPPSLKLVQEQGHDVIYGTWVIGARYGNATDYHGAYPATYLERMVALFPDLYREDNAHRVLHAFSGSLPPGPYLRLDLKADREPEIVDSVYYVSGAIDLGFSDPPYTDKDAGVYGVEPINRGKALRSLALVTVSGGFHVWLDVCWPMHRKDQWRTVGRITVIRSTNHVVRMATIFERV